jgi:hypothetical protein
MFSFVVLLAAQKVLSKTFSVHQLSVRGSKFDFVFFNSVESPRSNTTLHS